MTLALCKKYDLQEFLNKDIVVYEDRISYFEKHKDQFKKRDHYINIIENLDLAISSPIYLYYDESKKGLEFYYYLDEYFLVAVRATVNSKELKVKSVYPVDEDKMQNRKNKNHFLENDRID